jgi:hypothetical protein
VFHPFLDHSEEVETKEETREEGKEEELRRKEAEQMTK